MLLLLEDDENKYHFNTTIRFIQDVLEYAPDEKLSKVLDALQETVSHPIALYDLQEDHVLIVNKGRPMTEAPYSIEHGSATVKIGQYVDFFPLFSCPYTNDAEKVVMIHSTFDNDGLLEATKQFIGALCDQKTKYCAKHLAAGYQFIG